MPVIVLKSEHEIAIMREAGLILRQALDTVRDLIVDAKAAVRVWRGGPAEVQPSDDLQAD